METNQRGGAEWELLLCRLTQVYGHYNKDFKASPVLWKIILSIGENKNLRQHLCCDCIQCPIQKSSQYLSVMKYSVFNKFGWPITSCFIFHLTFWGCPCHSSYPSLDLYLFMFISLYFLIYFYKSILYSSLNPFHMCLGIGNTGPKAPSVPLVQQIYKNSVPKRYCYNSICGFILESICGWCGMEECLGFYQKPLWRI